MYIVLDLDGDGAYNLKGGESNVSSAAKMLLNDFQRGKLPHYVKPPGWTEKDEELAEKEEVPVAATEETRDENQEEEVDSEPKTSATS